MRLRDVSEGELLARVFPVYAGARPAAWGSVPVGPGDDAAVVGAPGGSVVATTDSMVRGRDWRDDWSSAHDVGVKVAAQNLADVAAMGAVPTALLVSLVADPDLEVEWAVDLARGIASLAEQAGAPVVGRRPVVGTARGASSSRSPPWATCAACAPVLRSGARAGDVVAVCGTLGWSGEGWPSTSAASPTPTGRRRRMPGGRSARRAARRAVPRRARPDAPPPGPGATVAGRAAGRGGRGARPGRRLRRAGHRPRPGRRGQRGAGRPRRVRCCASATPPGRWPWRSATAEALHQVLAGGEEHSLVGVFADEASLPDRRR